MTLLNTHFPCFSQSLCSSLNFDAIKLASFYSSYRDLQVKEYYHLQVLDIQNIPLFKDGVLKLLYEMGYEEFETLFDLTVDQLYVLQNQLHRWGDDCESNRSFVKAVKDEMERRDIEDEDDEEWDEDDEE